MNAHTETLTHCDTCGAAAGERCFDYGTGLSLPESHAGRGGSWVCTITLSVKAWGTLAVTTREYATREEAEAHGQAYLDRRFARETAHGLDPFRGTEHVSAERPFGPLHRNVWTMALSQR
jgi:hypothetical protein